MTVDELSKRLSISRARAYELVRNGTIPAIRLGRQVRIDSELLEQWVAAGGTSRPDNT